MSSVTRTAANTANTAMGVLDTGCTILTNVLGVGVIRSEEWKSGVIAEAFARSDERAMDLAERLAENAKRMKGIDEEYIVTARQLLAGE